MVIADTELQILTGRNNHSIWTNLGGHTPTLSTETVSLAASITLCSVNLVLQTLVLFPLVMSSEVSFKG